jgi:hypothetical protein
LFIVEFSELGCSLWGISTIVAITFALNVSGEKPRFFVFDANNCSPRRAH